MGIDGGGGTRRGLLWARRLRRVRALGNTDARRGRDRRRGLMWLTTGVWDLVSGGRAGTALRQWCRIRARVTGRARHTAEVEGRNAGRGGGSQ